MKPATMFVLRRLGPMVALLALALVSSAHPVGAQEPGNRAGLIIEYGPDRVDTLCVTFAEDSLTGSDLLLKSGLSVGMQSGGLGVQVCQIEDVGCEPGREPCWCQCLSNPCAYWTYFQWKDGAWAYAPLGATRRAVRDGDVDAWVWGDGKSAPVTDPGLVCAEAPTSAPAADTEATAVPTATLTPTPALAPTEASGGATSQTGFGCSSPALILLPLALLGALALWRR